MLQNLEGVDRILPGIDEPSSNDEYSVMRRTGSIRMREMHAHKAMHHYPTFKLSFIALFVSLALCISNFIFVRDLSPMPTNLYLQEHR